MYPYFIERFGKRNTKIVGFCLRIGDESVMIMVNIKTLHLERRNNPFLSLKRYSRLKAETNGKPW